MSVWDMHYGLDYRATATALTEANEMTFETPEARSKWIEERSACLFFDYAAKLPK